MDEKERLFWSAQLLWAVAAMLFGIGYLGFTFKMYGLFILTTALIPAFVVTGGYVMYMAVIYIYKEDK